MWETGKGSFIIDWHLCKDSSGSLSQWRGVTTSHEAQDIVKCIQIDVKSLANINEALYRREVIRALLTAVYFPPQAKAELALSQWLWGPVLIGSFHCGGQLQWLQPQILASTIPSTCQLSYRRLNHCSSSIKLAYRSIPWPDFGKSDHCSLLILPVYKLVLNTEYKTSSVHPWSEWWRAQNTSCKTKSKSLSEQFKRFYACVEQNTEPPEMDKISPD